MTKTAEAFRTISEVADDLDVPKHVLRFWEVKFPQIRPMKRGGGRRYYRPEDLELLRGIRHLLHAEGYTIKGVQKILREQGVDKVKIHGRASPVAKPAAAAKRKAAPAERAGAGQPMARDGRTASAPQPDLRTTLLAAVSELGECRRLLRGEAPRAEPVAKVRQGRARPSRS